MIRFLTLALAAVILTGISMAPAMAQMVDYVTVSTDKESYVEGEVVSIMGFVLQKHGGDVSITVTSPSGNLVALNQLRVGDGNTFALDIVAGGLMKEQGLYTIEANYSLDARSPRLATTSFTFTPIDTPGIMVDGTEFEPSFTIREGSVLGMHTNPEANTLIIDIEADNDGYLDITLPRMLIDSLMPNGDDDAFFVLIDGEEVQYMETSTTDDSRMLRIDFIAGSSQIEIIGTSVAVPEFGTIAALVLAVAIISIVAMSARSKLSLMPRF